MGDRIQCTQGSRVSWCSRAVLDSSTSVVSGHAASRPESPNRAVRSIMCPTYWYKLGANLGHFGARLLRIDDDLLPRKESMYREHPRYYTREGLREITDCAHYKTL